MRRSQLLAIATMSAVAFEASAAQARGGSTPQGEARQVLDTMFVPPHLGQPTFAKGAVPLVVIDAAHQNFHTASGRYRPFAKLLENDGFRIASNASAFSVESLKDARVLVIANALNAQHTQQANWKLPAVSAFSDAEVARVADWVRNGGALLLIADHMPFAGDAAALAAALGVHFTNGFALLGDADSRTGDYPIVFRRSDGSLEAHAITNGRTAAERIDSVESFTGSAFAFTSKGGSGLMALPSATRVRSPDVAWQFTAATPEVSGAGLLQGAVIEVGRGRVAIFGEAAMFTAQRKGAESVAMGMNALSASQNPQFVLNVLHWLVKSLP